MITYSTSPGSRPARSRPARIATDPSSVAGRAASPPPSLPNGVRTAATMTVRVMVGAYPRALRDTRRRGSYDVLTVAVAVKEHTPFVVLDEKDRIVEVGARAESQFGPLVGASMWDCFPGSEPLFRPYYDAARRSREPVEFVQYYDGNVSRIRAAPLADGRIGIEWEQLARLDTLTLGTLAETLDRTLEALAAEGRSASAAARQELRVIEGGR